MHTEIFDGNKNNIELPESQTKPPADLFKQQKVETTISPSTNQDTNTTTRDTSSENIDVTTIPVTSAENNDVVTTSQSQQPAHVQLQQQQQQQQQQQLQQVKPTQVNTAAINSLVALSNTDVQQTPQPQQPTLQPPHGYTREILPPNSIYGIESLTSKPYETNEMKLPEGIHSPRYPAHNIQSPHHSSPDKDPNRQQQHRTDNNWVSPVKAHNYRAQIPPTSPYVDGRDPNYAGQAARRYVPPAFYANGRNYMHPNDRTGRYNGYPLGSPLMATLGYPRDGLDTRYPLHMPTNLGFEEEKFKLSPPSIDDKHIWTKQEVELLLDLYEEHKSKLQDPRVRKTKVWDDIAKQIHEKLDADVNGCQCNQKFRNMKADYQKVVEHNARSGSFRKTCKYYERLEKLLTPVGEQDKLKEEMENNNAKYFNGGNANGTNTTNGAFNQAPNGITNGLLPNGFYESGISRTSSSPESEGKSMYENGTNSSGGTPNSPGKRPLDTANDDSSPPPSKRQCNECNSCGGVNKRELIELLKEFLKEQRKREEETIQRIQILHKEKIDTVVKFLDLFQELVKKV